MSAPGNAAGGRRPGAGRGLGAARWVLGLLGVAAVVFGLVRAARLGGAGAWDALLWMAGGVVLHDAVLAPLTLLATLALRPLVPAAWRTRVAAGLVVLGTVTLTAVPVLGRPGARADNPTLLDRDYAAGWWAFAGVVLAVTLLSFLGVRRRPTRSAVGSGAPEPGATGPTATED